MDNQKQSIIDRIKQATNILVTVSANPSVDQLSACLGLTIALNEVGKHATAVFSGQIPSTIEFLKPEKTIEKNTDSLRDFIIALDKSKADKLRYKVEDKVVKIFITPYRTSISEKDLQFSQGDFNVEVVVCLGIRDQKDLDQAITSHGRILHDATVISINTVPGANLGTLNWVGNQVSSLSEMVASVADQFGKKVLDNQIATALLTGIVAETDRFSNNKTTPDTMSVSAMLMAAGANQQLVATELQAPPPMPEPAPAPVEQPVSGGPAAEAPKSNDGTLQITHENDEIPPAPISASDIIDNSDERKTEEPPEAGTEPNPAEQPRTEKPAEQPTPEAEKSKPTENLDQQIHIDERGQLQPLGVHPREFLGDTHAKEDYFAASQADEKPSGAPVESSRLALTPPTFGGTLTDSIHPEALDPATDPLSQPKVEQPILHHNAKPAVPDASIPPLAPPSTSQNTTHESTDHVGGLAEPMDSTPAPQSSALDSARTAAANAASDTNRPIEALNALPLGTPLHENEPASPVPVLGSPTHEAAPNADSPADRPLDMPLPPTLMPPPADTTPPTSSNSDNPSAPPPVPPPLMPMPPTNP